MKLSKNGGSVGQPKSKVRKVKAEDGETAQPPTDDDDDEEHPSDE